MTRLAHAHGVSDRLIGLTVVAIGTSPSELATGVIAARRGSSDIPNGNVIGSNIFNVFLCLGVAATSRRIVTGGSGFASDFVVLAALTVLGLVFMRGARGMARWEGAMLVLAYLAFLGWRIALG